MSSRRVLSQSPPRDPRSRRVVRAERTSSYFKRWELLLDCGHTINRIYGTPPTQAICDKCPREGGIGFGPTHRQSVKVD